MPELQVGIALSSETRLVASPSIQPDGIFLHPMAIMEAPMIETSSQKHISTPLSDEQVAEYRRDGHLTIPEVFSSATMEKAIEDACAWGEEMQASWTEQQQAWFMEHVGTPDSQLRKLDNPVYHREVFRRLASSPDLVGIVEQLIGPGVTVFFSQVFFKSPEVGGPKPLHQDNFYFRPDDNDAMVTVWIALDEATRENGCLYYGNGSHLGEMLPHSAPPEEPFNLQISKEIVSDQCMTPAPVPRGGISFHHGLTLHQSSSNRSSHWRRATAMHFLRNDTKLVSPPLEYDLNLAVQISKASGG